MASIPQTIDKQKNTSRFAVELENHGVKHPGAAITASERLSLDDRPGI
jgi:hypothetical protein